MIQPNELRIGNWVNVEEHQFTVNADFLSMFTKNNCTWAKTVTPIPLTPEILEKAGFVASTRAHSVNDYDLEYDGNTYVAHWHRPMQEIHSFGITINNNEGVDEGVQYFSWHIKSLHQLQNLYFALTNSELEYKP